MVGCAPGALPKTNKTTNKNNISIEIKKCCPTPPGSSGSINKMLMKGKQADKLQEEDDNEGLVLDVDTYTIVL